MAIIYSAAASTCKGVMVIYIFLVRTMIFFDASESKVFTRAASLSRPPCNGRWCYSDHKDYPNLDIAMTGYNIIKGNPFVGGIQFDPGFSNSYIFKATRRAKDGETIINDGIHTVLSKKCSLKMETDFASTVHKYQKSIIKKTSIRRNFDLGLDAEVEAGVNGLGINTTVSLSSGSAFSSSEEMKDMESFLTKHQGVVAFNEATCTTYNVSIERNNPPPFDEGFVAGLKMLNSVINQTEKIRHAAANNFLNEFGTHYVHEVTMGARLSITRKYSRTEYRTSTDFQISECNKHQFKYNLLIVYDEHPEIKCKRIGGSGHTEKINGFSRETITSYGSNPAKDLLSWSYQKFNAPQPIEMQLLPILNLFQRSYFIKRHPNIDYRAILKFLAPAFYSYCESNKDGLGVDTCDVSQKKGCGWSDTCDRRTEVCFDGKPPQIWCVTQHADKSIVEQEVKRFEKEYKDMSNLDFGNLFYKHLIYFYPDYDFSVTVFFQQNSSYLYGYDGDSYYYNSGKFGRNIIVGWARKDSWVPDDNAKEKITNALFRIKNGGHSAPLCDQTTTATGIYNIIRYKFGYPVSMVNTVVDSDNKYELFIKDGHGEWLYLDWDACVIDHVLIKTTINAAVMFGEP